MIDPTKSPAAANGLGFQDRNAVCNSTLRAPRKKVRVLTWFLSGRSANRFDAAHHPEIADSCLNSTVAELEGDGIRIDREDETVPGRYGPAHVKRYRLNADPGNLARARAMLELRTKGREVAGADL